jgi:hypothetical protein
MGEVDNFRGRDWFIANAEGATAPETLRQKGPRKSGSLESGFMLLA